MQYAIPEMNFESLEKKLTRIKNKSAKYGCEFKYEVIGEHFEEKTFYDYDEVLGEVNGQRQYRKWTETIRYIDIDVEGTAAINGWKFAASLEFTEGGNIINGTGEVEIPEKYYSCSPWCEHCKTSRDRRHSYIVFNEETGEFKQVGKSCLRDFTGGLSAEYVANYESFIKEVEEATEFSGFGGWSKSWFDVEEFMSYAAETIRLYGYCKRDGINTSTADRAEELYRNDHFMRLGYCKAVRDRLFDAEMRGFNAKNPESVELAKNVREWIVNNERNDNYFHNLKVACSMKQTENRNIGLLVSAFPAYNRELEFEAKRRAQEAREAEAAAKSSHMGNVGDKVSFEVADFRVISSWDTQWGVTMVYKFADKNGLEATWKTSNWIDERKIVGSVISGKVKEQKEYHGIKQTELTRCRIQYRA